VSNDVNISLGINTCLELEKIEALKMKELADRTQFEELNPEVILPSNLDAPLEYEDFPPLNNSEVPLKDKEESLENSWVKVASKSCMVADNNLENDRSHIEC
jgi:hypothetical protein